MATPCQTVLSDERFEKEAKINDNIVAWTVGACVCNQDASSRDQAVEYSLGVNDDKNCSFTLSGREQKNCRQDTHSQDTFDKNHSGVKTCGVAETRAHKLPQIQSPKSLRPSQESKLILEMHINKMMYKKILEKKITELRSPKKWKNLEKIGQLVCRILNYLRHVLHPIANVFRRFRGKHCRF